MQLAAQALPLVVCIVTRAWLMPVLLATSTTTIITSHIDNLIFKFIN